MSQMNQPGGFGGPRVVKPQANVYTVLLAIACLFMAAALVWQVLNLMKLRAPQEKAPGAAAAAAGTSQVLPAADLRTAAAFEV
jgi:hypothetical protein